MRLIREREALRRVPVVILSGHIAPESQETALAAGCSDYLMKPLALDQLDRILRKHPLNDEHFNPVLSTQRYAFISDISRAISQPPDALPLASEQRAEQTMKRI